MAIQDDIARYDASQRSHNWQYQWWERDAFLKGMTEFLEGLKASPAGVPRCYRTLHDDGMETLAFRVHEGDSLKSHGTEFNISHPCPPLCGDG